MHATSSFTWKLVVISVLVDVFKFLLYLGFLTLEIGNIIDMYVYNLKS